jgi:predicted DCC family thiol-disulfide oxidoreductase YuxK
MEVDSDLPILFYDGDCGFCNKSVQFVLQNDASKSIHFAALQSTFAQRFFKNRGIDQPDLSTLYFYHNGKFSSRSTGVLYLVSFLKFRFQLLRLGWLIPRFARDAMYNFVAKRRKKLAKGFCAMPLPEERTRFLS